jgi:hypothetical protein
MEIVSLVWMWYIQIVRVSPDASTVAPVIAVTARTAANASAFPQLAGCTPKWRNPQISGRLQERRDEAKQPQTSRPPLRESLFRRVNEKPLTLGNF